MDAVEVKKYLMNKMNPCNVGNLEKQWEKEIPDKSGIYAIFIDNPDNFPSPFNQEIIKRGINCIYIGNAYRKSFPSLQRRLSYDLYGKGDSTFFCSIGAVLGFRPPRGSLVGMKEQYNYRFSLDDKMKIICWIKKHLKITWIALSPQDAELIENILIAKYTPILNLRNNPTKYKLLKEIRTECRNIAKSKPMI
jgi:hypothetical protein